MSSNGGGWSSTGLSCLIGLSSPIWCFIGPDAGAHMSEELKDASITLPKAMLWVKLCFSPDIRLPLTNADGQLLPTVSWVSP